MTTPHCFSSSYQNLESSATAFYHPTQSCVNTDGWKCVLDLVLQFFSILIRHFFPYHDSAHTQVKQKGYRSFNSSRAMFGGVNRWQLIEPLYLYDPNVGRVMVRFFEISATKGLHPV
jgi:hypothetical protein